MSCQTCGHTMQCFVAGNFGQPGVYWCPRCGTITLRTDTPQGDPSYVPKLVERCREFEALMGQQPDTSPPVRSFLVVKWRLNGIAEAINRPEHRPT